MSVKPQAVLSGREIIAAIHRQFAYNKLNDDLRLRNWWQNFRRQQLHSQPRIVIAPFDFSLCTNGGPVNPNSYNLSLHDELLTYDLTAGPLDMHKDNPTTKLLIPPEGLVMQPGMLYLGRTVEWTETYNLVPRLDGRSSIGRLGICIHVTAAYGDNFYRGTWTLEMTVIHPVRIYAGSKICQISYAPINTGEKYCGKYQNSNTVQSSRFYADSPK